MLESSGWTAVLRKRCDGKFVLRVSAKSEAREICATAR